MSVASSIPSAAAVGRHEQQPILEAREISKYFGAVTALENVHLRLYPGEVLGVVGDNGAGKSTLMKVLSGVYPADRGEIMFQAKPVCFNSPRGSRELGIEMVYQDLALAGNMQIDENVYLGREVTRSFLGGLIRLVDHNRTRVETQKHLDKLRIHVKSVTQRVEELSGGQRQAVAIARATAFSAKVVIMDEPTAALAIREVRKVLDLVKGLREVGVGVIVISHRMDDIFYVCDRVMALYHGRNFAQSALTETSRNEVIGWIMGTLARAEHDDKEE